MMKGHVFLVAVSLALSPVAAFAGFDFNKTDQALNISNDPASPMPEVRTKNKKVAPVSDPKAPALQVYEERYLPEHLQKKYGLGNDWYAKAPEVVTNKPKSIEPFIVDDGPEPPVSVAPLPVPTADVAPMPEPKEAMAAPQQLLVEEKNYQPPKQAALPAAPPTYEKKESWRARKGEQVRHVLDRWSKRESTELMWAADTSPTLQKDFTYIGGMQEAVAALIKSTGTDLHTQYRSEGMTPVMMSPASAITSEVPAVPVEEVKAAPLVNPFKSEAPRDRSLETRWFALSGASLGEVLQAWAENEDAQLIWQTDANFALKDSVSQVGHFEDAVYKALSQFDNDRMRPIGQLYRDPATGKKVLVVKAESQS